MLNLTSTALVVGGFHTRLMGFSGFWMALHPEQVEQVVPPVAKHGHAQTKAFAASAANCTGMTKRSINRHFARAEVLGDDLDCLMGTTLDKGVELDELEKLPVAEREALVARAAKGEHAGDLDELLSAVQTTFTVVPYLRDVAN